MNDFAPTFTFKRFAVDDRRCAMKVGTDGVLLGAWAQTVEDTPVRVADIGAGSGLIAMMIAQRYPLAKIDAVEINSDAYSDLCRNVAMSEFSGQIEPICGDYRILKGEFDLIVSNPPFFSSGVSSPEFARTQAREAGELSPMGLLEFAVTRLARNGRLALIVPNDKDEEIEFQAALHRLNVKRKAMVSTSARRGVTRTLWEFTKTTCPIPNGEKIVVGSEYYRALTSPFYLNF